MEGLHKSTRRDWVHRCAAMAAAAWQSAARASQGLVLRFSHVVAPDTPKGMAAERFKVLLEQRTQGRIQVQIFPNAQLYGDRDEMTALSLGAVEFVAPSLSKFGRLGLPQFELFDLPFYYRSLADVRRISQGPLGQRLFEGLSPYGLVGLGYFDNGFKQMSAHRPLRSPADFVGLKMRIQASGVIADQMRCLGAEPVVLPFHETRTALARGVVHGTENPLSNFWTQRMDKVQPHLSLSNHGYLGYAVVTNARFWQRLSTTDRNLIQDALQESLFFANQIADAQNSHALQALHTAGTTRIHSLQADELHAMRRAVAPVRDRLQSRIGAHWLDTLKAIYG
ncbi:MAG: TRAP transporter substrate-binding protein [Rhodoferax sp.]